MARGKVISLHFLEVDRDAGLYSGDHDFKIREDIWSKSIELDVHHIL